MESNELMTDILLSEIIAADMRAKRSLRVVEHQEGRVDTLTNQLSKKSDSHEELKQQYMDLLQVHAHQKEVQGLQRQLIEMQEIELLLNTPETMPLSSFKTVSKVHVQEEEVSQKAENRMSPDTTSNTSVPDRLQEVEPINENQDFLQTDNNAYQGGHLLNAINSNLYLLGFGSTTRKDDDEIESRFDYDSKPCSGKDKDLNSRISTSDQLITSKAVRINEDGDQIKILSKTLSSHRQCITCLSSEVIELREERQELLSYMKTLLDSRRSSSLERLIQEADSRSGRNLHNGDQMKHDDDDGFDDSKVGPRKEMYSSYSCTNLKKSGNWMTKKDYNDNDDEDDTFKSLSSRSDLELRATRLWNTASRFFTPDQAHFILTTSIPSDESSNDDDEN